MTLTAPPAAAQLGGRTESRPIRPNRRLLAAGVGTLAAAYAPSVVIAATSDRDRWLYVPVLGPWADLGNRGSCSLSGGNCNNEDLYRLLIITAGITQFAGAFAIVASFVVPEYKIDTPTERSGKADVRVAPIRLGSQGYGLGLAGHF